MPGTNRRLTYRELMIVQQFNKASKGELRAFLELMKLDKQSNKPEPFEVMEEDLDILKNVANRFSEVKNDD